MVSKKSSYSNGGYAAAKSAAEQKAAAAIGMRVTTAATTAEKTAAKSAVKAVARESGLITKTLIEKTLEKIPGVLLGDQKAMETGGFVGRKITTEETIPPVTAVKSKLWLWLLAGAVILFLIFRKKRK